MKKLFFVVIFSLIACVPAFAEDTNTYGEPAQEDAVVVETQAPVRNDDERINRILQGQERIIKKLDEIQSELQIVKVRASQQ